MSRALVIGFLQFLCMRNAQGHGAMALPATWHDKLCLTGHCYGMRAEKFGCCPHASCSWFTNFTFAQGQPTLTHDMHTYANVEHWARGLNGEGFHPWLAPGTAPIHSPCGIFGGNPHGCPPGNDKRQKGAPCAGGGSAHGHDARSDAESGMLRRDVITEWKLGSVVEVAWGIVANHGGGYSYRLCKVPTSGSVLAVNEHCFQQNVLDFEGDTQWVEVGPGKAISTGQDVPRGKRWSFKAKRTIAGTHPKGSMWTRNPIPPLDCKSGGDRNGFDGIAPSTDCQMPWFPPPVPGFFGFGGNFNFTIVDLVRVPEHLESGDYVLSWRWDGEQTSQVWATCADVRLVASDAKQGSLGALGSVPRHASHSAGPSVPGQGRKPSDNFFLNVHTECEDISGWANGYTNCALDPLVQQSPQLYNLDASEVCRPQKGFTCKMYEAAGYCHEGSVVQDWTMGIQFLYPETACCVCGGGTGAQQTAEDDCPSGTFQVRQEAYCQEAALELGFQYLGTTHCSSCPRGCFSHSLKGSGNLWFNTYQAGSKQDTFLDHVVDELLLRGSTLHSLCSKFKEASVLSPEPEPEPEPQPGPLQDWEKSQESQGELHLHTRRDKTIVVAIALLALLTTSIIMLQRGLRRQTRKPSAGELYVPPGHAAPLQA